MNRGVLLHNSPVQQMMAGNPDWSSINAMRPPPPFFPFPPPQSSLFPHFIPTSTNSSSWHELPESWSQLLLEGLVGEEGRGSITASHQANSIVYTKQENSLSSDVYGHANEDFHHHEATKASPNWSTTHQIMAAAANSRVTSFSNNMLDFSGNKADCNSSTATGGTLKKTRVQPSATQSTFKVRKEKLGDRITALHQLVSPFGKTDTASVLLEAIGYIRFLHSQIEVLSIPYLDSGSSENTRQQQFVQGERICIFPEDPGQLLNENCMKKRKGGPGTDEKDYNEEPKKDLKSRSLCLVPISCTLQVGSDNGADYWAPPSMGGGFR